MKLVISSLLVILVSNQIYCLQKVRGVVPERASLYDPSKPFTCLDGSSKIPFDQVNDDYCDCRDGSDEPGTSACMNSSFACENLGYIVQMIPSSRVNDGICDCCDGSDEYDSKVTCENTCNALAVKMREEEEKLRVLVDQGKAKRKQMSEEGNEIRKALEEKLKELEVSKHNTDSEITKLRAVKTEAENKSKEAKEKQDKILEEKAKALEKLETLRIAKVLFTELDANKDNFCSPDELLKHTELDILFDNDGQFTLEESKRLLDQNEKIDFEVFSTVYFEKIAPHIQNQTNDQTTEMPTVPTLPSETEEESSTNEPSEHTLDDNDNDNDKENQEYQDEQTTDSDDHSGSKPTTDNSKYDAETQKLIEEFEKADREFQDASNTLTTIEKEIKDIKDKIELDTGSNAEFASMMDKCFEYEDREYVYKLCPFDKTVQKSKSNSAETTIGHWSSWGNESANRYQIMKFNNGLACWNGPQRSTLVRLSCGLENKVIAVSEPNRCEYEMKFETPAICDDPKSTQSAETHEEL